VPVRWVGAQSRRRRAPHRLRPADRGPAAVPLRDPEPDAVVVSHGHLDHVGAVPALLKGDRRPTIHWTPPTAAIARVLARDTLKLHGNSPLCPFSEEHVARLGEVEERHTYAEPFVVEAGGTAYEVTLFNAGHIPGSAHVLVDDGNTRLLHRRLPHRRPATGVGHDRSARRGRGDLRVDLR